MYKGRDFEIPYYYQIVVNGSPDADWITRFDGFLFSPQGADQTLLSGIVHDQAALHGIFNNIREMGLSILFVKREDWGDEVVSGPSTQVLKNHLRAICY